MTVSAEVFKDMLVCLSERYDISERWIINNGVYLLYMLCDGLKEHIVDAESILLSEKVVFKEFNEWIK